MGWRQFLSMLTYKTKLYGHKFITVDPKNTTQTCANCVYVMSGKHKLTLNKRKWVCPKCHTKHIRDWNTAKNILAKGLSQTLVV